MENFNENYIDDGLRDVIKEKNEKICQQEKDIGSLKREIISLKHEIESLQNKNSEFLSFSKNQEK